MSAPTQPQPTQDRPQPGQTTPNPEPVKRDRWQPQYAGYCCDLAQYGDWCDCAHDAAELAAAFGPADWSTGALGPILLDLTAGGARC